MTDELPLPPWKMDWTAEALQEFESMPEDGTGTPWMDLPERFGSWKGAHSRLRMWALDGTWERVFAALLPQADAETDLDWVVAVDSTIVRAHQHAAGARQKGPGRRAGRPCPRTVPRRADHEDPLGRRRLLPPSGHRSHSRPGR